MASFNECKILSTPMNRIVEGSSNPHGDLSVEKLNELFLQGKTIDLQSVFDSVPENAYMTYDFSKIKFI
jgi:hypothetical protein